MTPAKKGRKDLLEIIRKRELEKEMLLTLSYEMAVIRDKADLLTLINTKLKKLFYFTHSSISAINEDRETFVVYLTDPESRSRQHKDYVGLVTTTYPIKDGVFDTFIQSDEPVINNYEEIVSRPQPPKYSIIHYEAGLKEAVSIKLHGENEVWGVLHFYSDIENIFTPDNLGIIKGVASQVAIAVSNILAHEKIAIQLEEIRRYKLQLEQENFYLQQEIDTVYNYTELIGAGPAMQQVYRLLSQVSNANTTVLILGETGTGKELIARAIHNGSPLKDKLMVKVNCAALPGSLIESELFGHEKGSFTGAIERRIGKFELANNSTLFLDEIGELSLEMQAKLLRAIQEKEIERVGGRTTIKVNIRIIAATNRDLQKEVAQGKFRSDLYYRLNVFPIGLPPLRERKEDIPTLTAHFINRYARNAGRKTTGVSGKVAKEMQAYHWPGNVRELEHLIERSVLLTEGTTITSIHLPENAANPGKKDLPVRTLEEMEREYILRVLKQCNGKVQGLGGAAGLLGIPPTTLHSKMKKLGIRKKHVNYPPDFS
jgi:transcriptional regulator with GAF, ATPase, and Fis domain